MIKPILHRDTYGRRISIGNSRHMYCSSTNFETAWEKTLTNIRPKGEKGSYLQSEIHRVAEVGRDIWRSTPLLKQRSWSLTLLLEWGYLWPGCPGLCSVRSCTSPWMENLQPLWATWSWVWPHSRKVVVFRQNFILLDLCPLILSYHWAPLRSACLSLLLIPSGIYTSCQQPPWDSSSPLRAFPVSSASLCMPDALPLRHLLFAGLKCNTPISPSWPVLTKELV